MPIYAYRCESCGHAKDVLQKISDPLLSTCPSCKTESFRKQITAAGFQLKGSGWYVTDFKGGSSGGAAPASTDTKTDGASAPAAPAPSTGGDSGGSSSDGGTSAASGSCGGSCACH